MSSMVPDGAPRPRLAHVAKSPDFVGYGFNLHAEKGKAGQFIGDVDDGSPAASAGLHRGDRIVEVNSTNIANENHQQVVQRVKAIPNETKLLVVDPDTDKYYREKKIVIRGDMPNILRLPAAGDYDGSDETTKPADDTPLNNNSTEAVSQTPDDSLELRLCHLAISPDFSGYGFNLHSEKGKAGQFIGTIDPGSPAETAGLREGDRIFEVNEVPINSDEHKHVVQKIKLIPNKTKLLVADAETARWYRQQNIVVSGTLPNIKMLGTVPSEPVTDNDVVTEAEVNHSSATNQVNEVEANSNEALEPVEDKPEERMNGDVQVEETTTQEEVEVETVEKVEVDAPLENNYIEEKEEETAPPALEPEPEPQPPVVMETVPEPESPTSSHNSYSETRAPAAVAPSDSSSGGGVKGELFSMSVKEARARIGGRKKRNEVKQSGMSSKAKYDLFQKL